MQAVLRGRSRGREYRREEGGDTGQVAEPAGRHPDLQGQAVHCRQHPGIPGS